MNSQTERPLKDTEVLSQWIKVLSFMAIAVSVASMGLDLYGLSLFDTLRSGGQGALRQFEEFESRQSYIGWIRVGVYVMGGIMGLIWVHHMNANARTLGAEGMRFTPGWAVGWYFIPIANLWMPYRAMKEIWQAHADPRNWQAVERPAILPLWWALVVAVTCVDRGVNGLIRRIETLEDWRTATIASAAADALQIALIVVFVILVLRLMALQQSNSSRPGTTPTPV